MAARVGGRRGSTVAAVTWLGVRVVRTREQGCSRLSLKLAEVSDLSVLAARAGQRPHDPCGIVRSDEASIPAQAPLRLNSLAASLHLFFPSSRHASHVYVSYAMSLSLPSFFLRTLRRSHRRPRASGTRAGSAPGSSSLRPGQCRQSPRWASWVRRARTGGCPRWRGGGRAARPMGRR